MLSMTICPLTLWSLFLVLGPQLELRAFLLLLLVPLLSVTLPLRKMCLNQIK